MIHPVAAHLEASFDPRRCDDRYLACNPDAQQIGVDIMSEMIVDRFGPTNAGCSVPWRRCPRCQVAWADAREPCWVCGGPAVMGSHHLAR